MVICDIILRLAFAVALVFSNQQGTKDDNSRSVGEVFGAASESVF